MAASERQALEEVSPWWGEHVHRYQVVVDELVKPHVHPDRLHILDVACGNGFGSAMLFGAGATVIGGDVSKETLAFAASHFEQQPNLRFEFTDATALPFADATFDAITSFETLEHVHAYETMLTELVRVLKPGGILYLSTPNFVINSPSGVVTNPYHVKEFIYDELYTLLNRYFINLKFGGQQYMRYLQKKNFRYRLARVMEWLMYQRGIRKLPISFQDLTIKSLINKPMYPTPADYTITYDPQTVLRCKTFFVKAEKKA